MVDRETPSQVPFEGEELTLARTLSIQAVVSAAVLYTGLENSWENYQEQSTKTEKPQTNFQFTNQVINETLVYSGGAGTLIFGSLALAATVAGMRRFLLSLG